MSETLIKKYFDEAKVKISAEELRKFAVLYGQYNRYNEEWDLSRLTKPEDIILKHFIDSVLPARLVKLPDSLVDIGTGPGFPGIPVKIVSPSTRVILAEPRFRRVDFMNMMIKELGLEGAEVYPHLVTEESNFDVQGVITRAFERAGGTLERVRHFLPKGGKVILLKGPGAEDDLKLLTRENAEDYDLEDDISYKLPILNHDRRILVFRKLTDYRRVTYRILLNDKTDFGTPISSPENKRYKELKKSAEKGPKKTGIALVAGRKIIKDILKTGVKTDCLLLPDDYCETDRSFLGIIEDFDRQKKLFIVKKALFSGIESSKTPVLAIESPEMKEWKGEKLHGCTVVIPFQDPVNVGAAIRSAAAFGIKNILILKEAANPYLQKSIRSSSGAVFSVNILSGPSYEDITDVLEEKGIPLVTLDKDGTPVRSFDFPESFFIMAGIEGQGITDEMRKYSLSIPIEDCVESLNAYAALSIALYEYRSRP